MTTYGFRGWDNPTMKTNIPLAVLAWLGALSMVVGIVLIAVNQGGSGTFDEPNYQWIWTGAGIASFGATVIVIALAVWAIGFYIERASQMQRDGITSAGPTPADDARADVRRAAHFNKVAKSGGLSWSNDPD